MSKAKKLSDAKVRAALKGPLAAWAVKDGKLHRAYAFEDFVHAFGFMATSAVAIEAMNHHPEWSNVWNRVVIDLMTHDAGGITAKDLELAARLESFATKLGAKRRTP